MDSNRSDKPLCRSCYYRLRGERHPIRHDYKDATPCSNCGDPLGLRHSDQLKDEWANWKYNESDPSKSGLHDGNAEEWAEIDLNDEGDSQSEDQPQGQQDDDMLSSLNSLKAQLDIQDERDMFDSLDSLDLPDKPDTPDAPTKLFILETLDAPSSPDSLGSSYIDVEAELAPPSPVFRPTLETLGFTVFPPFQEPAPEERLSTSSSDCSSSK
ncbi:hypothetical protein F4677DRAFT_461114 [Hypoxylon crocopeplum]|nr:hypothetical protein F4677DRAFT_461114 [Hypoxylon crocopeplum]